jgi:general secretion pathway protein D
MKPMNIASIRRVQARLALLLLPVLLVGCAADRLRTEGLSLINQGRYEEGLFRLEEATRQAPSELEYKSTLILSRDRIVLDLNAAGDRALAAENAAQAETLYRRALAIDPKNERALAGMRALDSRKSVDDLVRQAQSALERRDVDNAGRILDSAQAINPRHVGVAKLRGRLDEARVREATSFPGIKSKMTQPVSLEFREANLKMVFDVLARSSGINFVFDKDVRSDLKVTIFVQKLAVEDAVELLLLQNQLEKRVLNENTLLIYPNTPQKGKDYQDLVVKTFYLANSEAKQTMTMLKTILKTKDIFADEKLNLVVMRDTPDAIRIAEKLIASQDLAEPEVLLEVEVLEVTESAALDLGIEWPGKASFTVTNPVKESTTTTTDGSTTTTTSSGAITLSNLQRNKYGLASRWLALSSNTPLTVTLNAAKTNGDIKTLATPRIRARNHEKAKVLIGSRVPVITNSVTPVSTGTPVVTGSVNYLDVGLKLEVEPTVHLEGDVVIKLNLEVSNITNTVTETSGTRAYEIGTRNASTTIRLNDGETQVLAGLIQNDQKSDASKIPLLGEIPILGRLFGSQSDSSKKTEIMLSITPRVVHNMRPYIPTVTELVSGSETSMKAHLPGQRTVPDTASVGLKGTPALQAPAQPAPSAAPVPSPGGPGESPAPAAAEGAASITLQGPSEVKVGQEFVVALQGRTDAPMTSSAVQLSYDPSTLRVVEISEGDLMKSGGGQTNFSQREEQASGKVFVGLARSGGKGAKGQGTLMTVKFAAKAPKPETSVQVAVFSGVAEGNRLLAVPLPPPLSFKVNP